MRRIRETEWSPDIYFRVHEAGEQIDEVFPLLDPKEETPLDAILIPGGGLQANGEVTPWVRERLEAARRLEDRARYLITLSKGTIYKAPVMIDGVPIHESVAGKRYLIASGVPEEKIIVETESLDTLGNAFYARTLYTDTRQLRRLLILTSGFHMVVRAFNIFYWVFNLPPENGYEIHKLSTPNVGFTAESLTARLRKELESTRHFMALEQKIKTLSQLADYMHSPEYKNGAQAQEQNLDVLRSY